MHAGDRAAFSERRLHQRVEGVLARRVGPRTTRYGGVWSIAPAGVPPGQGEPQPVLVGAPTSGSGVSAIPNIRLWRDSSAASSGIASASQAAGSS